MLIGKMWLILSLAEMMLSVSTSGVKGTNPISLRLNGRKKKMMNSLKLFQKKVLSNGKKYQKLLTKT